ncbi:SH3 domain-containing protein [Sagittula salina]|uniref:SH3 domain-containing protein n=1 Tax=Sagittula salina TaxID=2820268 RepID=A0A940MLV3_9RHOB|nr:SH3 domain-containing protein [Sagittula salina]MBP0484240.1 SH3 domain-containing protein [Sagittula salina]
MPRLLPLLASLVIATAAPLSAAWAAQALIDAPRGTTIEMRRGPAEAFDLVRLLRPGATVDVLGNDPADMWVKVRHPSGAEGWIRRSALAQPPVEASEKPRAENPTLPRASDRPDWIHRDASRGGSTGAWRETGRETGRDSGRDFPRDQSRDDGRERMYVSSRTSALNLRQGPGTNTAVLDTLQHGSPVTILGGGDPWRRVRSESGQVGYVHGNYLTSEAPLNRAQPGAPARGTRFVDAPDYGALNLRQGPGTDFAIAATMSHGTQVEVLDGGTDNWRLVRTEDGAVGFAAANYLSVDRPAPRVTRQENREEYRDGRRVIRVTPQELPGLLAACAFSGNLDRCIARQIDRRDGR